MNVLKLCGFITFIYAVQICKHGWVQGSNSGMGFVISDDSGFPQPQKRTFELSAESSTKMTATNQSSNKPVVILSINRETNTSIISNSQSQSSSPKVLSKASKFVNKPNLLSRKIDRPPSIPTTPDPGVWECPNITQTKSLECGCDLPHTLRCSGDLHGMALLARALRESYKYSVSLLDCTLKNVSILSEAKIFENISLHGLVISSGEIKRLHRLVFDGMKSPPLYELGLPNNALTTVPSNSLQPLSQLDRLDLSNNKIKMLSSTDFTALMELTYLDLSENQISSISPRTFNPLQKLIILKINGNRLGAVPSSLQAIGKCLGLRELDLRANSIRGPLHADLLPTLKTLRSLNLDKNTIGSIKTSAFQNFPNLVMLSLRQCQIDVLEDHCFAGLGALQELDLSSNGIVSISDFSLQHLPRLVVLDLKHNFLRAVTSEMIAPLSSLKELRLDGNDISIVEADALKNVTSLKNLSLLNNPLACDCKLRPFAEWLYNLTAPTDKLLGAVCALPPRLEGAPLLQIPVRSLTCDAPRDDQVETEMETIVQQINNTFVNDNQFFSVIKNHSDSIVLAEVNLSIDYGLLMMWNIAKPLIHYTCDTLFVFEKFDSRNILRNSSPINCEYNRLNSPNSFTVIIPQGFDFSRGDLYKFCLTLINNKSEPKELFFGCSNYVDVNNAENHQKSLSSMPISRARSVSKTVGATDISTLENVVDTDSPSYINSFSTSTIKSTPLQLQTDDVENETDSSYREELDIDEDLIIRRRVLLALGAGILLASIIIFILALYRVHQKRQRPPTVICPSTDSAEYVKLQATTTF